MAFESIDSAEIDVKKPITKTLMSKIKNSLDWLYGETGSQSSQNVPNGNFELDTDGDGIPNEWTRSLYPGGAGGVTATHSASGSKCLYLSHPGGVGNGGGAFGSAYIPCSSQVSMVLSMVHWCTDLGMHNYVTVDFYDKDKVYISTGTLYDSTTSPTSERLVMMGFTPPAGARFFKINLVGGETDVNVAGTAFFDALSLNQIPQLSKASTAGYSGSSSSTAWADVGTFTVTFPYSLKAPVKLLFAAKVSGNEYDQGGGSFVYTTGYMRIRVGASYSNEISAYGPSSPSYAPLIVDLDTAADADGSTALTVTVQLYTNGSASATGSISAVSGVI